MENVTHMPRSDKSQVADVRASVVVMAHPRRLHLAKDIAERVGGTVVLDPDPDGPPDSMLCAAAAWEAVEEGATHHVVLQDDVLPCSGFRGLLLDAIATRPDEALCLFGFASAGASAAARLAALLGLSWFLSEEFYLAAPAVAMPADVARGAAAHLHGVIARRNAHSNPDSSMFRDALQLRYFLDEQGMEARSAVVSLVEHDALGVVSLMGGEEKGLRRAACFREDIIGDVVFDGRSLGRLAARPFVSYEDLRAYVEVPTEGTGWRRQKTSDWLAAYGVEPTVLRSGLDTAMARNGFGGLDRLEGMLRRQIIQEFWNTGFSLGLVAAQHGRDETDPISPVARAALRTIVPGALNRVFPDEVLQELLSGSEALTVAAVQAGQAAGPQLGMVSGRAG